MVDNMHCETVRKIAPRAYRLRTLGFIYVEASSPYFKQLFFLEDEMMSWVLYTEITGLKVQPGWSTHS